MIEYRVFRGLVTALFLAAATSGAVAERRHDGSGSDNFRRLSAGNTQVVSCGTHKRSVFRTNNTFANISSTNFVTIPGASVSGQSTSGTDCVKVTFTAETSCSGPHAEDFCYVRARLDGSVMDPNGANFQAMDSEDGTASAHSYTWIRRLSDGNFTVDIQGRTFYSNTDFELDDWTMEVEILD